MNQKRKENYTRIFRKAITDLGLSGNDLLIFSYINRYTSQGLDCYVSQVYMADMFNIDRSTVQRSVKRLETSKLINVNRLSDRIIYRVVEPISDGEFFDIYESMTKKNLSGNELLVYAYMHRLSDKYNTIEKDIADYLKLSAQGLCDVLQRLVKHGLVVLKTLRNKLGMYIGKACILKKYDNAPSIDKDAYTVSNICTTKTNYNNKLNNNNAKSVSKIHFSSEREIDFDEFERMILAN